MHDSQILILPVSAINLADTGFKISRDDEDDISALAASISLIGMTVPPLVTADAGKESYLVVSGFKRLAAAVSLGWETIPCRRVNGLTGQDFAKLAVAENAFLRELGPGEQIRAIILLARFMDERQISKDAKALFNAQYNAGYIKRLTRMQKLPPSALPLLDTGGISIKAAVSLTDFDPKEAKAFLDLFAAVKLSASKQMEIITWVREICAREEIGIPGLLNEMATFVLSQEDKGHKDLVAAGNLLRAQIYTRRYPALDQAKKEAMAHVHALKLPKGVRISLPENFESMVYSMSLAFKSPEEFQEQIQVLGTLVCSDAFTALLKR